MKRKVKVLKPKRLKVKAKEENFYRDLLHCGVKVNVVARRLHIHRPGLRYWARAGFPHNSSRMDLIRVLNEIHTELGQVVDNLKTATP